MLSHCKSKQVALATNKAATSKSKRIILCWKTKKKQKNKKKKKRGEIRIQKRINFKEGVDISICCPYNLYEPYGGKSLFKRDNRCKKGVP